MQFRSLGKEGPKISRVGVGTAPIGSSPGWKLNWGPQSETDAVKAIQTALDVGVNWIDTAPFYGWGRSERIIGKAIEGRREQVHIFTKCGAVRDESGGWTDTDCRPETMRREVDEILKRIGTDYVDLLQLHEPDPNTPVEDSWKEMQRLIRAGKVRYGGLSNHSRELMQRALRIGPIVSSQNQFNPFRRAAEKDIFPFCLEHDIGVLSWGSLSEGVLADEFDLNSLDPHDFRRRQFYAQLENREKVIRAREVFGQIARARGKKMVDIVVAWELTHQALTGVIIGVRNEKEAREMIGGVDLKLSTAEIAMINNALTGWE